jgi:hypothetical protein
VRELPTSVGTPHRRSMATHASTDNEMQATACVVRSGRMRHFLSRWMSRVFLYFEISHHDGWPLCARGVAQSGGLSGDGGARGGSLKMAPPPPPDPPLEPSRAPGESSGVLGALCERANEAQGGDPLISALRGTAAASGGGPRAKASSSSIRPRRARSASCTSSVTCGERAPW